MSVSSESRYARSGHLEHEDGYITDYEDGYTTSYRDEYATLRRTQSPLHHFLYFLGLKSKARKGRSEYDNTPIP